MEGSIIDEDGTIFGYEVTMYRDGKNNEELIEGIKKIGEIILVGLNLNISLRLKKIKNQVI